MTRDRVHPTTTQSGSHGIASRPVLRATLLALSLAVFSPATLRAHESVDSFLSARDAGQSSRQVYLGGIIGADFATLDLGYRFFAIDESTATADFIGVPFDYPTNFAASELLLTLRIYEPFRRWRNR